MVERTAKARSKLRKKPASAASSARAAAAGGPPARAKAAASGSLSSSLPPGPPSLPPGPPSLPPGLLRALSRLSRPEEMALFLSDLLTPAEIEAIAERWQIATLLTEGKSQREVASRLGASITTVSRGSRMLKYGQGGFRLALRTLEGKP